MPLYVVETMGSVPGLSGLFVAGIFSASLSTVSACLNSLAAVTLEDYIKPVFRWWTKTELANSRTVVLSKLLALGYGLVCIAMAFLSGLLGGVLQASLSIFGMVGGPLLGIFSLGMFCPCANEPGAVVGLLAGLVVALIMGFGGPKPPTPHLPLSTNGCSLNLTVYINTALSSAATSTEAPTSNPSTDYFYLYRISYLYYIVISFALTVIVGVAVSWFSSLSCKSTDVLNPDLFVPPIASYLKKRRSKVNIELVSKKKSDPDSILPTKS